MLKEGTKEQRRARMFQFMLLANACLYLEAGAVPAVLLYIANSFNMSSGQQGLLGGIVYLALSIGGPFAGFLLRHYDHRTVVACAVSLNCILTFLWTMTPTGYWFSTIMYIGLRFLMGLMQCVICVFLPLWTNDCAPKDKRTSWMSYLQASVPLGVMGGYVIASTLITFVKTDDDMCGPLLCWRWPFVIEIIVLLPVCIGIHFVPRDLISFTVYSGRNNYQKVKDKDGSTRGDRDRKSSSVSSSAVGSSSASIGIDRDNPSTGLLRDNYDEETVSDLEYLQQLEMNDADPRGTEITPLIDDIPQNHNAPIFSPSNSKGKADYGTTTELSSNNNSNNNNNDNVDNNNNNNNNNNNSDSNKFTSSLSYSDVAPIPTPSGQEPSLLDQSQNTPDDDYQVKLQKYRVQASLYTPIVVRQPGDSANASRDDLPGFEGYFNRDSGIESDLTSPEGQIDNVQSISNNIHNGNNYGISSNKNSIFDTGTEMDNRLDLEMQQQQQHHQHQDSLQSQTNKKGPLSPLMSYSNDTPTTDKEKVTGIDIDRDGAGAGAAGAGAAGAGAGAYDDSASQNQAPRYVSLRDAARSFLGYSNNNNINNNNNNNNSNGNNGRRRSSAYSLTSYGDGSTEGDESGTAAPLTPLTAVYSDVNGISSDTERGATSKENSFNRYDYSKERDMSGKSIHSHMSHNSQEQRQNLEYLSLSESESEDETETKPRKRELFAGLKVLYDIKVYVYLLGAMSSLYFVVTGVQYWGTSYMAVALEAPLPLVQGLFIVVAAFGPTLGVFFGGWCVDKRGGYKGARQRVIALEVCTLMGGLGFLIACLLCVVSSIWTFTPLLFLLLFTGGATLPACSGIVVSSVPRRHRTLSSSVSLVVFNLFGYCMSLVLSGYAMQAVSSFYPQCDNTCVRLFGFRVVLLWSFWSISFLLLALFSAKKTLRQKEQSALSRRPLVWNPLQMCNR